MSKDISFSIFLDTLEDYENVHAVWCSELIANGRQALQSVFNHVDYEDLTNLMDSFMHFVSLLSQCNSNSFSDKKKPFIPSEQLSKIRNESQDLLPKNDIIKMVNRDLQCPICNEWLCRATSANCNHTFCEKCIKKWLKINKTCPVCRTSIQYISTSIAIHNFISNLCQLFGYEERQDSIQNTGIDDNMDQTSADYTTDELINNLSISQLIEDDTYNSQLEMTAPLTDPNMVLLIPRYQSPLPIPRLNSSQFVTSNSHHLNNGPLSPAARIFIDSQHDNQLQHTFSTSLDSSIQLSSSPNLSVTSSHTNTSDFDINTPILHPNTVNLIPCPRSPSTVSRLNSRQPVVSSNLRHPNTVQLSPSPKLSVTSSHTNASHFEITMPITHPNTACLIPCPQTPSRNSRQPVVTSESHDPNIRRLLHAHKLSITSQRDNHLEPTSSVSVNSPNRIRTDTNIGSSSRYHSNIVNLIPYHQTTSLRSRNVRDN